MTDSINKQANQSRGEREFIEDEESVDVDEEMEAQNNFLTQAELFKSYSEQNNLYCNLAPDALWFEFGGQRIGRMSLEIVQLKHARK